jgi:deoxyribose-phosphate aldolase
VAAARHRLHGPDHAQRRRLSRSRASALRQGAQSAAAALGGGLGIEELHLTVGAVCVYHAFVETAVKALEGSGIPVAAVSTGFPAGLSPLAERVDEIHRSVEAGAEEIDIVITRAHVFNGDWQALYDEIAAFKQACGLRT